MTSHGAKASTKLCIPGSPACECGPTHRDYSALAALSGRMAACRMAAGEAHRPNTGFRPCRPMPTSRRSSQPPECARQESSATIRSSSRRLSWPRWALEEEAGAGFHHHMALCVTAAYAMLGLRTESDSPLRRRNAAHAGASPIPGLSTPQDAAESEPNATSKRQSQRSELSWRAASRDACPVVLVANEPTYDTVRLDARFPRA